MARPVEDPVETQTDDPSRTRITHPAFAQIVASRVSGLANLYGSDFAHQNYVTITISKSETDRHLSNDWHHAKNEMIEVALTEAQWATFVSSMNVGGGVPCTLQHHYGAGKGSIPGLPSAPDRTERFAKEMQQNMVDAQLNLDQLETMIMDSKLSGVQQKAMRQKIDFARREIGSSSKFVADQFDEHMETTVEKAKIEVNAYATKMIMQTGLSALGIESPIALQIAHVPDEDL